MKEKNILEIEDLILTRTNQLTHPLNLILKKGNGLGIYGPNGSGKSTLLDTIAGILPQKNGNILINGKLGYAMQAEGFQENMTCLDCLRLEAIYAGLSKKIAKERISQYSKECAVDSFLSKKINQLSAGMKVRLMLTASLLVEPEILLLDESFNALDEESIIAIKEILKKQKEKGLSILFVSHNKDHFIELCESILYFPELKEEMI